MPTSTADMLDAVVTSGVAGCDGLRLVRVPLAPEVRLHLADDAIVLRARLEAQAGQRLAAPYWADAWVGGQAVARYILDNPWIVAGRRVLDVASGSGLVAIAAAVAGAAVVTANDIDPYALAAIDLNARANGVAIDTCLGDVLGGDGDDAEVILAGDVFYGRELATRMLRFVERAAARGAHVLVGDPGRAYLPRHRLAVVAGYPVTVVGAPEDAQITWVNVLQPVTRAGGAGNDAGRGPGGC